MRAFNPHAKSTGIYYDRKVGVSLAMLSDLDNFSFENATVSEDEFIKIFTQEMDKMIWDAGINYNRRTKDEVAYFTVNHNQADKLRGLLKSMHERTKELVSKYNVKIDAVNEVEVFNPF